jgi:Ca2+:H+ antiporter
MSTNTSTGSKRKVKRGLRAKLGRRRHEKVEIVDQVDGEASQQPPEASTEGDKGKKAEIVEPSATEVEGQTSTAKPATPTGKPVRGGFMPRGLSFRAPPVFRSGTDPVPQKFPGENAMPHHVRRLQSQPNINGQRHPSRSDTGRPKKLISRNDRVPTTPSEEGGPPPLSQTASIILLLASTGLVALCAEFLVGSIEHLVENSPLSEAFVGLIILPIVVNAAEHVTAVTVAAKNKVDLALGVSLGSSIQIALFVAPIVVILGWILDKDMSLYFNLFETATLFVSTFIVNFLVLDGRSNYLEGALLCACYVIIA